MGKREGVSTVVRSFQGMWLQEYLNLIKHNLNHCTWIGIASRFFQEKMELMAVVFFYLELEPNEVF